MKKFLMCFLVMVGCSSVSTVNPVSLTPNSAEERDNYFQTFQTAKYWSQGVLVSIGTKEPSNLAHTAQNSGRPFSFVATVRALDVNANWYPKNPVKISDPRPELSKKIAEDKASNADVHSYAVAVAQMTFCRGGSVTKNTTAGFSYSSPEAIAAVLSANNGALGPDAVIPKNAKQSPLPVVERRREGIYSVRLRCSRWSM